MRVLTSRGCCCRIRIKPCGWRVGVYAQWKSVFHDVSLITCFFDKVRISVNRLLFCFLQVFVLIETNCHKFYRCWYDSKRLLPVLSTFFERKECFTFKMDYSGFQRLLPFCLYINYQLDALIIIYSQNIIFLYMFRASSAHLEEDTIVYMQHTVLSLSMRVRGGLSVHRQATTNSRREWQYHMLHVYNCILLKMST